MAENQILPFAYADGANVLSQTDYVGDNQRLIGHQPGIARSALENKALRQLSAIAAGTGQFLADNQDNEDVTDAKTPIEIAAMFLASIKNIFNGEVTTDGNQYLRFGNGVLIQWGGVDVTNISGITLALPVAYTVPKSIVAIPQDSRGMAAQSTPYRFTAYYHPQYRQTHIILSQNSGINMPMSWITIGFA